MKRTTPDESKPYRIFVTGPKCIGKKNCMSVFRQTLMDRKYELTREDLHQISTFHIKAPTKINTSNNSIDSTAVATTTTTAATSISTGSNTTSSNSSACISSDLVGKKHNEHSDILSREERFENWTLQITNYENHAQKVVKKICIIYYGQLDDDYIPPFGKFDEKFVLMNDIKIHFKFYLENCIRSATGGSWDCTPPTDLLPEPSEPSPGLVVKIVKWKDVKWPSSLEEFENNRLTYKKRIKEDMKETTTAELTKYLRQKVIELLEQ